MLPFPKAQGTGCLTPPRLVIHERALTGTFPETGHAFWAVGSLSLALWSRALLPLFLQGVLSSTLVVSLAPAAHLVPPRLPAPSLPTVVCSEQRQDLYSQFVVAPQRVLHLKPQPTHSV